MERVPRILFAETHFYKDKKGNISQSAVDYWRSVNPAKALQKARPEWKVDVKKKLSESGDLESTWLDVAKNYDIIHFSYSHNFTGFGFLEILRQKHGLKYVLDLDDDLMHIRDANPVSALYKGDEYSMAFLLATIAEAQYMSVTNKNLKRVYKKIRDDKPSNTIAVLPNGIDLNLYNYIERPKKDKRVTILHQGGPTHYEDLLITGFLPAISYLLGKYQDSVKFVLFGAWEDTVFAGLPNVQITPNVPYDKFVPYLMDLLTEIDICVAPLHDNEFNAGKSNIKLQEYWSAKKPVVASNVAPYKVIVDGKTGFRADTTREWIEYLEILITDGLKRKEIGEQSYDFLTKNLTIEHAVKDYVEFYERILK